MKVILIQLPIPGLNLGRKTGNIPLAAACLKQAADGIPGCHIDIFPEALASHAGDAALIQILIGQKPDIIGFTVFSWNLERSLYLAGKIKETICTRIIFGGPEITPDNTLIHSPAVDFFVFGEGEAIFRTLLTSKTLWLKKYDRSLSDTTFLSSGSPYVKGYLEPGSENLMLLETQRGCPYRCGFCYYNKSKKSISIAGDPIVLDGIAFAIERKLDEIYLLDPSLNSRPGLPALLEKIAGLNIFSDTSLISEIRAESVDEKMAQLYRKAGFKGFEVGLQSTNPTALKKMNRPTDLNTFIKGVKELQKAGISTTVDLIFGLPGDTLEGFCRTLDFVYEQNLDEHLQVFPLLVLPGTSFRKKSRELGLIYEPKPPYTLISTPDFSAPDMIRALDMAEEKFDTTFCTFPDLEISFQSETDGDIYHDLEGLPHLSKLVLNTPRDLYEIETLASRITSPLQIFFGPDIRDTAFPESVLTCITGKNPFVPLEVIFIDPVLIPDTRALLAATAIRRPHFLDQDLRYLYPAAGNRAVQFTVITKNPDPMFQGDMKRQIFLWDRRNLPENSDFQSLSHLDGILIESYLPLPVIESYQDRISRFHEDILPVNFAGIRQQVRWMERTAHDKYNILLLKSILSVR